MPTLITLVSSNNSNGSQLQGALFADAAGDLFGTAGAGGANNLGTVFEIAKTAGAYASNPTTLFSFNGVNGAAPQGGLIADAAGDLFGTTAVGGVGYNGQSSSGDGTVFEIAKTAGGYASSPTTLVAFNGANGAGLNGSLIADGAGDLFGTTFSGGANNQGTVYEIAKTAGGYASAPTTLVSFDGVNGNPYTSLLADAAGDLFGTLSSGTTIGAVFEIAKTAGGYASTPTILVTFNGANGGLIGGSLIADAAGDLFGTTARGGANDEGTVYEIAKTAGGYASAPTTLVTFNGANGAIPAGSLIADAAGDLFGTTAQGGANNLGTVYEIAKTAGVYASAPTTLVTFNGANGSVPQGSLIADGSGNYFGTTNQGGANNDGTAFEIVISQTFNFTTGVDTFAGGAGDDTFNAATLTLSKGDVADGGGGTNTLQVIGGGKFDLRAPTTLTNIQVVTATEGAGAAKPTINLRSGLNVTLNMASGTGTGRGAAIIGAADSSTINLGDGADSVTLGSATETAHGGGGADTFNVTAATIGATIDGGTGKSTLVVSGSGASVMGPSITRIATVKLTGATLTFTGNATNLTITVGAAGETLHAGGGADTINVTGATIGATIDGGPARSTLVVNSGGNAVMGANITNIAAVTLKAATNFTANTLHLTITGSSGGDTIAAGGTVQTLTGGLGADTLIGFSGGGDTFLDKTANLNGDTIQNFAASGDKIDITDMKALGASLTFSGNILKVTNGVLSASITLTGTFTQSDFTIGHDAKGDVLITQAGGSLAPQAFAQAMAALGANGAAHTSSVYKPDRLTPPMLAAAIHAAWA